MNAIIPKQLHVLYNARAPQETTTVYFTVYTCMLSRPSMHYVHRYRYMCIHRGQTTCTHVVSSGTNISEVRTQHRECS